MVPLNKDGTRTEHGTKEKHKDKETNGGKKENKKRGAKEPAEAEAE